MARISITLEEGERQLVLLALGRLAAERRGFDYALGSIAIKLLGDEMYRGFRDMACEERGELPPSIICPRCGRTSYHPGDVEKRYCGNCHQFHDDFMGLDR